MQSTIISWELDINPSVQNHECIKEASLVINFQFYHVYPVFLCILGLPPQPFLHSSQCLYKTLGKVRWQTDGKQMARDATTPALKEKKKKKNRTAEVGGNTGMALLVEAAIVWVHMLKTVLLEQKRRKVVVWVLG